jgi:hypothetical protein
METGMIVDCGERMLRMLQIAQRRRQVLSDPRGRLLSHTDAAEWLDLREAVAGFAFDAEKTQRS